MTLFDKIFVQINLYCSINRKALQNYRSWGQATEEPNICNIANCIVLYYVSVLIWVLYYHNTSLFILHMYVKAF